MRQYHRKRKNCTKCTHEYKVEYLGERYRRRESNKRKEFVTNATTHQQPMKSSQYVENWRELDKSLKKKSMRTSKYLNNKSHLIDTINFPKKIVHLHAVFLLKVRRKRVSKIFVLLIKFYKQWFLLLPIKNSFRVIIQEFLELTLSISKNRLEGPQAYLTRTRVVYKYLSKKKDRKIITENLCLLNCAIR